MAEAQINIGKFNGGEISPRAQGHLELPQYKAGGQEFLNVIPNLVGGLERRQGTQYVAPATGTIGTDRTAFSSNGSWLIPFDIADGSSYVMEFSDYKIRFYRDGGTLLHSRVPFKPANINLAANQFEIPGHGLKHGQIIKFNRGDEDPNNPQGDSPKGEFINQVGAGVGNALDDFPAHISTDRVQRFSVVLPRALRTLNPIGNPDSFAVEALAGASTLTGQGLFSVFPEMGPYHVHCNDARSGIKVETDVWIGSIPAPPRATSLKVNSFTISSTKGGTPNEVMDGSAGQFTLEPTLEALSSTFRIALPQGNLGEMEDDIIKLNTVGSLASAYWSIDNIELPAETDYQPYEISSPWSVAEASRLQYTKDGDVMIIASGADGHPLYRLQRVGVASFSLTREKVEGGPLGFQSPFGVNTEIEIASVTSHAAGNAPTWTSSSSVFRGTDVGRPIRKTYANSKDGLRHFDGIIKYIGTEGDGHIDFTVYSRTARSVKLNGYIDIVDYDGTESTPEGSQYTSEFEVGDQVWVSEHPSVVAGSSEFSFPHSAFKLRTPYFVVEKKAGTVLAIVPPNATGFITGQDIRLSATRGGTAIGAVEVDTPFGAFSSSLLRHVDSIVITKAELTSVSALNEHTDLAHNFIDGTEWAGLWIEGIPPTGLNIGNAYKVRTIPDATTGVSTPTKFRLQTMQDAEVPIGDAGSGRFTCNAHQNLKPTVRARLVRTAPTGSVTTPAVSSRASTNKWRIGQWNGRDGHPGAVAIHQERLIAAGSTRYPMTIWGSEQAIFNSFIPDSRIGTDTDPDRDDRSIIESSAWGFVFDSESSQRILWIFPSTVVLVGTSGPIHQLAGFTPTTLQGELVTNKGSSAVRPVISDSQIVWGSSKSYRVLSASFEERRGGLLPEDLTLLADHAFTGQNKLVQLSLQEEPWSVVWAVREDGLLWSCTYDREQGVKAWAQHKIGGSHSVLALKPGSSKLVVTDRDHAAVKSICTVPSSDERFQEVWMVVERHAIPEDGAATSIDSVYRSVEFLTRRFELDDRDEDAFYVDCGIAAQSIPVDGNGDPIPATTFTGHNVLANRKLSSWIDADDSQDLTANAAGTVTLETPATSKLIAGIPYSWKWRSLSVESILSDIPSATGMQSQIPSLSINLVKSRGGSIGTPDGASMQRIDYSQISKDIVGEPIPLRTGRIQIDSLPDSPGRTNELILEGEGAAPFFCTNIVARITGGEDGR